MVFKRFEFTVFLLVVLILGASLMFAWSFFSRYLQFSKIYFGGILLLLSVLLFMIIKKNRNKTFEFLEDLKHEDSLRKVRTSNKGRNDRLQMLMNEIAEKYSNVKIDKESQNQYFLNTIKHLNTGIVSFTTSGNVELVNDAFLKMFHLKDLRNVKELNEIIPHFAVKILNLKLGRNQMLRLERENELLRFSVSASEFLVKGMNVRVVSFQDIRNELQQEEIEAQQKLIRVLTHEIMNSVSPIVSLTSTLLEEIDESETEAFLQNAKIGLTAINKRSEGLAKFVDAYKSISKLPDPHFEALYVRDLLNRIEALFRDDLQKENIALSIRLKDEKLKLLADAKMLEQVFINIIRNSIESFEQQINKQIWIDAFADFDDNIIVSIQNNGLAIPKSMLDKVFLPFFTTKQHGTGIGLSLSRQILQLHKASINVKSNHDKTIFRLIF